MWAVMSLCSGLMAESYQITLYVPLNFVGVRVAFIIPVFSAYRLAKFNLDDRQTTSFLGLPTPANGLFWISYTYGLQKLAVTNENLFYLTTGFILVLSWLMISEIPMFSLKIKSMRLKGNERQAILVLLVIAFMALWGIIGIAGAIVAYILLSVMAPGKRGRIVK